LKVHLDAARALLSADDDAEGRFRTALDDNLRASGETRRRSAPSLGWLALSPQELQIAELAAEGSSNKEIARQLFLSHRTVGSHLYRIFPKLGITTRSQLQGALKLRSTSKRPAE
jgi:DNA-binding CsgD family transcriptional regulator